MKAPAKGGGYHLLGYGMVTVKWGPSPEHPYVGIEYGSIESPQVTEIHIDDFKERRLR